MDTQVFRLETLKRSATMTNSPLDREHVTLLIRNRPEISPGVYLVAPPEIHWREQGLELDEPSVYEMLILSIEYFEVINTPPFLCRDSVRFSPGAPEYAETSKRVICRGDT